MFGKGQSSSFHELQLLCRQYAVPASGSKSELVRRLLHSRRIYFLKVDIDTSWRADGLEGLIRERPRQVLLVVVSLSKICTGADGEWRYESSPVTFAVHP